MCMESIVEKSQQKGTSLRRICFASNNIGGLVRNGVATANTSLAKLLAFHGHKVTILFSGLLPDDQGRINEQIAVYKSQNIDLKILPQRETAGLLHLNRAYDVYQWLSKEHKKQSFDIIHFSECQGHGYYAVKAKQAGQDFTGVTLAVSPHGSLRWCHEGNQRVMQSLEEFSTDAIEQKCIELADVVLAPSQHMLDWIQAQGWRLPDSKLVRQYVLPISCIKGSSPKKTLKEIVFFGRLEIRKGIHHFINAIAQIEDKLPSGLSITFLGEPDSIDGISSADYITRHCKEWKRHWKILDSYGHGQAMDYIQGEGRLSVIASIHDNLPNTVLECLALEVPFICSNAGGIPEMILAEDMQDCIFDLNVDPAVNLSASLLSALSSDAMRVPRFRINPELTNRSWIEWHANLPERTRSSADNDEAGVSPKPKTLIVVRYANNCQREQFVKLIPESLTEIISKIQFIQDLEPRRNIISKIDSVNGASPPSAISLMLEALSGSDVDIALFIDAAVMNLEHVAETLTRWFCQGTSGIAAFPLVNDESPTDIYLPTDTTIKASGFGLGVGACFAISSDLFAKACKIIAESPDSGLLDNWAYLGNSLYLSSKDKRLEVFVATPLVSSSYDEHSGIVSGDLNLPHTLFWERMIDPSIQFILASGVNNKALADDLKKYKNRVARLRAEIDRKTNRIDRLLIKAANKPGLLKKITRRFKMNSQ